MLFAEILFGSTKSELRGDILLIRTQVPISYTGIFTFLLDKGHLAKQHILGCKVVHIREVHCVHSIICQ